MAAATLGSTLSADATPFYPSIIPTASTSQKRRSRKRNSGDRKESGNGTEQARGRVQEVPRKFRVLTWNCETLCANKELALRALLEDNSVDIAALTETEIEPGSVVIIPGYQTFYPSNPRGKIRVLLFIKDSLHADGALVNETSGLPVVTAIVKDVIFVAVYRQFKEVG